MISDQCVILPIKIQMANQCAYNTPTGYAWQLYTYRKLIALNNY